MHDEALRGASDETIADRCQTESRVLLTLDLDFADIRAYPPASHVGVIVLRVGEQSRPHILKVLASVLPLLVSEQVAGRLWIVSESGVRIRQ